MTQSPRLQFISFPGEIRLIRNDQEMESLDLSSMVAFGFDTETRPSFKKGDNFKTALLQLATNSEAFLFRLHHITQFQKLRLVLEDPGVLKVGAAIAHDLRQLQRIFSFTPKGFVDIQNVAKDKNLKNRGLKGMTEEVLGVSLRKSTKMTNWDRLDLTEEQLMYAATDAWIGLELHRHLTQKV